MFEEPTAKHPEPSRRDDLDSTIIWHDQRQAGAPMPRTIGRCQVRHIIGAGGMGIVYEALQEEPRRTVAIKVMRLSFGTKAAVDRFRREADHMAILHHPGIVQVYEVGTYIDGSVEAPYFIMEFIPEALSITEYARQNKLDVRSRLELFKQVCDAVNYGNQKGVIHRDLKPSNILVDAAGQVRVIDFGVARSTDADLALTASHTNSGEPIGTLQYMSPEQTRADSHDIDARSDVYSLGVVLYELLTDHLPYEVAKSSVHDAIGIIKDKAPTRVSSLNHALRGDLETIVHAALEKDRRRRYQSAGDLGKDITHFLMNEPIIAKPPTVSYVLRTHTRAFIVRNPFAASLIAALLAALFAEYVGVPLVYRWTYLNEGYARLLNKWCAPPRETTPFHNVRILRIDQQTLIALNEMAGMENLGAINRDSMQPIRHFHAALMEKLADCGVKAVAFDLAFEGESSFDETFVNGVKALRLRGVDVVVSSDWWTVEQGTAPNLSRNIRPFVNWGGTTAGFSQLGWPIDLLVQRGSIAPAPSLALAAESAFLHPGHELHLTWQPGAGCIQTNYFKSNKDDPRLGQLHSESDVIVMTGLRTFDPSEEQDPTNTLRAGDNVGLYFIQPPSLDAMNAATIRYETALTDPIEVLKPKLEGKLVVIGYAFDDDDIYPTPDGRMVNGVYGVAMASESLLQNRMRFLVERVWVSQVFIGLAAIIGVLLVRATINRPWRRAVIIGALCAGAFAAAGWSYRHDWLMLNPLIPLLALAASIMLAIAVQHVRQARATSTGEFL